MSSKKWTMLLCMIISALFISIVSFNYVIDPYGIYKLKTNKYNTQKIAFRDLFQFKTFHIQSLQPEAIILGSSRAMRIEPAYIKRLTNQDSYNMGIYGSDPYITFKHLEYSIKVDQNLKTVYLGLDFETFNESFPINSSYIEKRLESNFYATDYFQSLLSENAIKDSFKVLLDNMTNSNKYTTNEFLIDGTVEESYISPHNTTEGTLYWYNTDYNLSPSKLHYIQEIKDICERNQITLYLYINPIHAILLEQLWQQDEWSNFEKWKRNLVEITPLWDFTGFNQVSMDTTEGNNFNDIGHFSKKVGNLIISKMVKPLENPSVENFGVHIDSNNIEQHLFTLRTARELWPYMDQDMNQLAFNY